MVKKLCILSLCISFFTVLYTKDFTEYIITKVNKLEQEVTDLKNSLTGTSSKGLHPYVNNYYYYAKKRSLPRLARVIFMGGSIYLLYTNGALDKNSKLRVFVRNLSETYKDKIKLFNGYVLIPLKNAFNEWTTPSKEAFSDSLEKKEDLSDKEKENDQKK